MRNVLMRTCTLAALALLCVGAARGQTTAPTPMMPHAQCALEVDKFGNIQPPDPCGLLADLHWAMAIGTGNPPHPRWQDRLDWTFNRWRNGSSENWGPIAHAIALFRPAEFSRASSVAWWKKFLACQNGEFCPSHDPNNPNANRGTLIYMKGSELLSNTYDAPVTTAVAAVNYWAVKNGEFDLATKARRYLHVTWTLYTLSAGSGPARTYLDDTPAANSSHPCQLNADGGLFYSGPYIAAAGMRSTTAHVCQEDRGPLLTRALEWSVLNNRETKEQAAVAAFIKGRWAPGNVQYPAENVFGLTADNRALLRSHIDRGDQAEILKNVLAGMDVAPIRTRTVYNFVGWADSFGRQTRLTLLEKNLNTNTQAVYAVKYTAATEQAHVLFPWSASREGVTHGKAWLDFTEARATNFDPDDPFDVNRQAALTQYHGIREVFMGIPSLNQATYHVVVGPSQPAFRLR